jgi:hypothetical protein
LEKSVALAKSKEGIIFFRRGRLLISAKADLLKSSDPLAEASGKLAETSGNLAEASGNLAEASGELAQASGGLGRRLVAGARPGFHFAVKSAVIIFLVILLVT